MLIVDDNEWDTVKKEKEEMMKSLSKTLPVLREKFLRELLFGLMEDMEDIYSRLSFLGLDCLKDTRLHVVSL